jgi:hypothetical protein
MQDNKALPSKTFAEEEEKSDKPKPVPKALPKEKKVKQESKKKSGGILSFFGIG